MNEINKKTPRLPLWILRHQADDSFGLSAVGDLEELYKDLLKERGRFFAFIWIWGHVLRSIPIYIIQDLYWRTMMLKSYFKMAIRSFQKHRLYSIINVSGLALGMACCFLILIWVHHELRFDRFHENKDRLYRILHHVKYNEVLVWAINQGPLGPEITKAFPEIVDFTRFRNTFWSMKYEDNRYQRKGSYVDSSFLSLFTFPLIKGDPKTALAEPHSVVLTEELAEIIFGHEDPMNKVINVYDNWDLKVTGVIKNIPEHSHLQFDFLSTMDFALELGFSVDHWKNSTFNTYLLLDENVDPDQLEAKIYNFLDDKPTIEEWSKLTIQSLSEIHLSTGVNYESAVTTNPQYVILFFAASVFILFIACINFMNLSTARSTLRAKEVGLRKVVGANRKQLIHQFIGESLVLALFSFVLSMGLVSALLPLFNHLSGRNFTLEVFSIPIISGVVLVIVLFTGLVSGSYPAFALSSFKPAQVIQGRLGKKSKGSLFRRILVVFQFSISVLLLIGTFIVYSQIRYMQTRELGLTKENVLYLEVNNRSIWQQYDAFKNELLKSPGIVSVSHSTSFPTNAVTFANSLWHWEGQDPEQEILFRNTFVHYDYFKTFGIDMAQGRAFAKKFSTDTSGIIINETALKAMGIPDPIGKKIEYGLDKIYPMHIIGVVKDFHFQPLQYAVEPLVLILSDEDNRPNNIFIRLNTENTQEAIGFVKEKWRYFAPDHSMNYAFVDEAYNRLYRTEERIGHILNAFSILAVFISCLGLFGLSSFMVLLRTKEIGIRKVLGARISGLLFMLAGSFSQWILLANMIAMPVAYFVMHNWLQNFANRTPIFWWIFAVTAVITLFLSLITVVYQVLKVAVSNPSESLRYE